MTKNIKGDTPFQDLLYTLNEITNKSGMSLREISRKLEKDGLNLYNVCAVANGHPENLSNVVKYDTYVSAVLRATGYDEYDLLKMALERLTNPCATTYDGIMSPQIREFIRNPESKKYIEFAYKKYRLDKLTEEQERIKKELESM